MVNGPHCHTESEEARTDMRCSDQTANMGAHVSAPISSTAQKDTGAVAAGDAVESIAMSSGEELITASGPGTEPGLQSSGGKPGSAEYGLSGEQVEDLIRVIKQLKKSSVSKKVCASDHTLRPKCTCMPPPVASRPTHSTAQYLTAHRASWRHPRQRSLGGSSNSTCASTGVARYALTFV